MAGAVAGARATPNDYDLDRIRGFSDCVFAVAITLVAATFRLPFDTQLDDVRLAHYLGERGPYYFAYLAGFVVVGLFWLSHHRLFDLITRAGEGLVWRNFALLFVVVLLPFPTEVLGNFRQYGEAFLTFNVAAALLGLANLWLWVYATRRHRLVDASLDDRALRIYRWRAAWWPAVFTAASLAAFAGPVWSAVCWALLPLGRPIIRLVLGPVPLVEAAREGAEVDDVVAEGLEEPMGSEEVQRGAGQSLGTFERMFRTSSTMGRLVSFSDNVYAFAITLLGSHFRLPSTKELSSGTELLDFLHSLASPAFVAYSLSFVVIARFWVNHHRVFGMINRQDGVLRVLNLLHLMAIAVLPFTTDLLSTFADDDLPFAVYAVSVSLAATWLAVIFAYAARNYRLLDPRLPAWLVRERLVADWLAPACFLASVPFALAGFSKAWLLWLIPTVLIPVIRWRDERRVAVAPA